MHINNKTLPGQDWAFVIKRLYSKGKEVSKKLQLALSHFILIKALGVSNI